jgi:hypothetical protein
MEFHETVCYYFFRKDMAAVEQDKDKPKEKSVYEQILEEGLPKGWGKPTKRQEETLDENGNAPASSRPRPMPGGIPPDKE